MSEEVRVRVAPSPTGLVHLGNTYTAYYNYAFARHHKGKFILRLDDTDLRREVKGAEEQIYKLWNWLGITWDEGPNIGGPHAPYKQSKRLDRYREVAERLLQQDKAYRQEGAIYLKMPETDKVTFTDLLRGEISVDISEIGTQVLIKSGKFNNYPTYMFATVVDEIDHQISHVIRGEDHLSNTPKQILIYEALEAQIPKFAHLPLLRNSDQTKLSKRQAHASLEWYREQGFLPAALKNFFGLMGWSHLREKEIFSEEEFISLFSLEDIKTTAPIIDLEKLRWLNGHYIRKLTVAELVERLKIHLRKYSPEFYQQTQKRSDLLVKVAELEQERLRTLSEFTSKTGYFFVDKITVEPEQVTEFIDKPTNLRKFVEDVKRQLGESDQKWEREDLEKTLRDLQNKHNLSAKAAFMTLRLILTGQSATPPLFKTLEVLGKEVLVSRLQEFLKDIQ